MLEKLDNFILAGCTKFSHWFQRLTGRTNYFLAKIGLILTVASISVSVISYVLPILPIKRPLWFVFLLGLIAIFEIGRMTKLDKAEKNAMSSAEQTKPFFNNTGKVDRMIWFFLSGWSIIVTSTVTPISVFVIIDSCFFPVGLLIFHYFIEVNPLPPCKSKIKEFSESISAFFSPAKTAKT